MSAEPCDPGPDAEPHPRRFRVGEGLELRGDAFGPSHGPPVLLLHGGGQTRHAWRGTAQALAARGWHAVALDLRGHGESDWHPEGRYHFEHFADDVVQLAAAFDRPPALVGASLGGIASLLAAGEAQRPVASALVLVDIATRLQREGVERILAFMRARPDGFASLDDAADAIATYLPHRPRPRDVSGLRKNLRRDPDGRYRWHWDPRFVEGDRPSAGDAGERMDRAARALRLPVMLVRGRMSDILSEEGAHHFLELVPHARYVDVSGAGHMVAGDRNDAFTRAVVDFLARAEAGGGPEPPQA